jgi:hypothetical protein
MRRSVTNFFSVQRLGLEKPGLPLHRMRWLEPGDCLDAGDRTLHLFRPPIFDGPTMRGLYGACAFPWLRRPRGAA